MPKTCAIVPAAGRGRRMGTAKPKQFLELSGKPILIYTLETLARASFLAEILLVVPNDSAPDVASLLSDHGFHGETTSGPLPRAPLDGRSRPGGEGTVGDRALTGSVREDRQGRICVVAGGAERQDSVFNGLQALPPDCDWVLIHDGVRPFASSELLKRTWDAALTNGAAIAALPASDTIKRVRAGQVVETVPREELWLVQTPQVFRREILFEAYREADRQGWVGTDDAFLVERLGLPVAVVTGERSNIKVTTPEDLVWGSWFLAQTSPRRDPSPPSGKAGCA